MQHNLLQLLFDDETDYSRSDGWIVVSGDGPEVGSGWAALVQTEGDCGLGVYRFSLNKALKTGSLVTVRFPLDGCMVQRECSVGTRLDLSGTRFRYMVLEVKERAASPGDFEPTIVPAICGETEEALAA